MRDRGRNDPRSNDPIDAYDDSPDRVPGKRSLAQGVGSGPAPMRSAWPGKRSAIQDVPSSRSIGAGGGTPLPEGVRARMESSFGTDFSAVRVHEDASAESMGAQAYARGTDVHFAPGKYDPSSEQGLSLIGHELTHVVQQSQGRGTSAIQTKGGFVDDAALEHEADTLGAKAARGDYVGMFSGTSNQAVVQRKTKVTPVAAALKDKNTVLGDGTPGNPGLLLSDFDTYIKSQADWFTEPSFSGPDRDLAWKVALFISQGSHVLVALPTEHVGEIAKLAPADATRLQNYVDGFNTANWTVQLATPAPTLARALVLGQALIDLVAFVPPAAMRIVIPEAGLAYLVDKGKLVDLANYYAVFKPTLETPAEWTHVTDLLDLGVMKYVALSAWIHDLHIFTTATLDQLLKNIGDTSRARPVMLILFSAMDWNNAFLQGKNVETAASNPKSLVLVVQGLASLADGAAEVTRVADTYGQKPLGGGLARLGQVVIAGHGSETSVELASPGTNPNPDDNAHNVTYDQKDINRKDPKKNDTELLLDTMIKRMDPNDVDIVFAGCLVNSHEIPADTKLGGNASSAQKNLQAALAKHPNLAEYVNSRIAAAGAKGKVTAANASATFGSFQVDPATGKMVINNPWEPKLGGTKLEYVQQGKEPEGALRAAIECFADSKIGPAKVTTEIRTRVTGLAASTDWWEVITRTGFELCLPSKGDVDAHKLLDVVHRIGSWFELLWEKTGDLNAAVTSTKPAEAAKVFGAMLTTTNKADRHIAVGANEAWMKFDASRAAPFMAALDASTFTRETFEKWLLRPIVNPKLATLLPAIATPTKGQLLLALMIAWRDGKKMPVPARNLLRAAAGGAKTTAFPAALGVPALLKPVSETQILDDIGLGTAPAVSVGAVGPPTVDGNVDLNHDGKNESYIEVSPHEAMVTATVLNVRAKPSTTAKISDTVKKGDIVRVMGATEDGQWSFVDHGGATGFLFTKYLQ